MDFAQRSPDGPPPSGSRCAELAGTFDDLAAWAAELPLDEFGEHLYRVVVGLVRDVLDDCSEEAT